MTNERQTVAFDELEEGKKYVCCDPDDQHFLDVIRKQDDRIIYEIFDYGFTDVGTLTPKRWNPYQYKPVGSTTCDNPFLNEL